MEEKMPAAGFLRYFRALRSMQISTHAAHACYFIALSVFPMLVLMFGLLRYTALQPEDLLDLFRGLLPEALLPHAWNLIRSAYENSSRLVVSLSALTALWSAGRGIYGLQSGLNAVYGLCETRSWLHKRLLCTAYTFLFLLVLLLTLVLHVFGNTIVVFLRLRAGFWAWIDYSNLRFFLPVLAQTFLFSAVFMFLPAKRHGFRRSLPGALLSSFGWSTVSGLFSLYVAHFPSYSNIFGSVYAVALAGFWLYICVSIVFYGALLNRILSPAENSG